MAKEVQRTMVEQVAVNVTFLTIAELGTRLLSFILILVVARVLGDTGLGIYSFVFAFSNVLLMFGDIGTTVFLNRELARDRSKTRSYLDSVLGIKVVMSAIFVLATVGVAVFAAKSAEVKVALLIVGVATLFTYITSAFRAVFFAYEKNEYYALITILETVISTGLGIILLLMGYGINVFLTVFILSYFSSFVVGAALVWKKFSHFFPTFRFREWMAIIRTSVPFWLTQAFIIIYYRLDTIMLTVMTNFAVVGWYTAAYRPVEALLFIPIVVTTAVFPSMSRLHFTSKEQLRALYSTVLFYLFAVILPIAVGTTLLADKIIILLYHQPSFLPAVPAIKILIWSEVFIFLNYITGYLLNAINKQALFTISVAVYTVLNAILNVFLIPRFQHVGSAYATLAATSIGFLTLNYFAARNGYGVNFARLLWKPLVSSAVMAFAVAMVSIKLGWSLPLLVIIGGAVYFALMLLLRGFGRRELVLLKKFIPFRAGEQHG